ncbi:hypothetical protein N779_12710 [Vibrio coralliilyticus OCN008]|nr:hypothetical protein N779_12710 [Vibrio coralliilyticus OCN008]
MQRMQKQRVIRKNQYRLVTDYAMVFIFATLLGEE